jgi:ribosome-associated translation inhibitor RaiA
METPVHIDFQGLNANEPFRTSVLQHVAALERRYGRITSCRVVIKGPSERHQTGGLYEINIRLALPQGREVNIDRTATADERHADPNFAINDAFKRARRRLQDRSRRMRGQVKTHGGQPIGTATRLEGGRGADDAAR